MDAEIVRRLDRQDRVLGAILVALEPPDAETEASAFDDLVEVLADLTAAVADMTAAIQALRSEGSVRFPQVEA
jgi:hypothetical protein